MLLAIDVGNTNTVFAVFEGAQCLQSWRLVSAHNRSADEYAVFLNQVFDLGGYDFKSVSAVLVSSVVPDANFHIQSFAQKFIGVEAVFVTKDNVPMALDVDRPEDVGADRLVNALAAKVHYGAPAIILDFGTATTFDVLNAEGAYAGGVIAPGIHLSIHALHQAASKLPKISVQKPEKVVGRSTVEAMRSGMYWGYASLIEGLVERIRSEQGQADMRVLATGGLAGLFAEGSDIIDIVDEELTLKGLYEIHKEIKG